MDKERIGRKKRGGGRRGKGRGLERALACVTGHGIKFY